MTRNYLLVLLVLMIFTSCQTYTSVNETMRLAAVGGDINGALASLEADMPAPEGRNYALYRMEKGMLKYINKEYKEAADLWLEADKKLDDLYTTSISKQAASMVINDTLTDYSGEAHERILLPMFTSMAFLSEHNWQNALVMARRTYDLSKSYDGEPKSAEILKHDVFSHYFSGMLYEAKKEYDNAMVEYKNALQNALEQGSVYPKEARDEIVKHLGRLAEFRDRGDILKFIKESTTDAKWGSQKDYLKKGEVYVIYESGQSPIKMPEDIILPIPEMVARVSYPKFYDLYYSSHYAEIYANGSYMGRSVVMENIGAMAQLALESRRVRDIAKMAIRVGAKMAAEKELNDKNPWLGLAMGIFNIASEVADTRGWTTLPDTLQVFRFLVPSDENIKIEIKPNSSSSFYVEAKVKAGEKYFTRVRTFN